MKEYAFNKRTVLGYLISRMLCCNEDKCMVALACEFLHV